MSRDVLWGFSSAGRGGDGLTAVVLVPVSPSISRACSAVGWDVDGATEGCCGCDLMVEEGAVGAILFRSSSYMEDVLKYSRKVVVEPDGGWDDPLVLEDLVLLLPPI